jgi:hypothetical protein
VRVINLICHAVCENNFITLNCKKFSKIIYQIGDNFLKVLSDENQGGSKLVSIDSFFFTV